MTDPDQDTTTNRHPFPPGDAVAGGPRRRRGSTGSAAGSDTADAPVEAGADGPAGVPGS
jgi:hypothetical protein